MRSLLLIGAHAILLSMLATHAGTAQAATVPGGCTVGDAGLLRFEPGPYPRGARVLRVGPQQRFKTLAEVANAARDGDVIEIEAGEYQESVLFRANDLWLRGVGGRPHLKAPARLVQNKAILVFRGANQTIENLEFSGARSSARNGAGIRHQHGNLTIRGSLFRDSDNGILTAHDPASVVIIEHSEFANNGRNDGKSHNIYIGRAQRLELRYSYSHGAQQGHLVKTRAAQNLIEYNWLVDADDGRSSYEIDIVMPGDSRVIGNLIVQAVGSPNQTIVSYAAGRESTSAPSGQLTVAFNTIYSRRQRPIFVNNNSTGRALVYNNVFGGAQAREQIRGPADTGGNLFLADGDFTAVTANDFRPTPRSKAIDAAVAIPGSAVALPTREPAPDTAGRPRRMIGTPDIGAFESCAGTAAR